MTSLLAGFFDVLVACRLLCQLNSIVVVAESFVVVVELSTIDYNTHFAA